MNKRTGPYVGVTGFTSREDVERALDIAAIIDRPFMVGVLVKDDHQPSRRHPHRYPDVAKVANLFIEHPRALNLVHFCVSGDRAPQGDALLSLYDLAGPNCHGFQFNGMKPTRDALRALHDRAMADRRPPLRIVMQVPDIMQCPLVMHYEGMITDLLIDESRGAGKSLDPTRTWTLLSRIRRTIWRPGTIGFGVAGGLSGSTIESALGGLDFGSLSWDAEGAVRDGDDQLDVMGAMRAYLNASARLLGKRA